MSVRKDQVQLDITFITDESKAFAKTILATKDLQAEIEKSRAKMKAYQQQLKEAGTDETRRTEILKKMAVAEKEVADNMGKIATEAKKTQGIDLSRLTSAQLVERAKQLEQTMRHISQTHPAFKQLQAELAGVNGKLGEIRNAARGINPGGAGGGLLQTILGTFGGLSLAGAGGLLLGYAQKIVGVSLSLDALQRKTATVFGESESIVIAFAEKTAHSLGLTRQEFINAATAVGDLLVPMGFTKETAAQLSAELVKQGGVLSAWSGGKVTATEATEILNKALLGERDALNQLGIDIKDSLVQDELKKAGLKGLTGESLRQAEALVTLKLITQQSTSANEDWAKNTDTLVRKKMEWRARVAELSDTLATRLVPVIHQLLDVWEPIVNGISRVIDWGDKLNKSTKGWADGLLSFVANPLTTLGKMLGRAVDQTQKTATAAAVSAGETVKDASSAALDQVAALEKQLADLRDRSAKELAEAQKKELEKQRKEAVAAHKEALDAKLKAIDLDASKSELALEQSRAEGKISEQSFGTQMLNLKKQQYEEQLAVFKRFHEEESAAAVTAQKNLLDTRKKLGDFSVGSNSMSPEEVMAAAETELGKKTVEVKQQITVDAQAEEAYRQRTHNEEMLNLSKEQQDALAHLDKDQTDSHKKEVEERKKADEEERKKRQQIIEAGFSALQDLLQMREQELSATDESRKKNAGKIKANQKAQVVIAGISEVQKIWSTAAELGPIAGPIVGAILTGFAIARTAISVRKIESQKFARGGYTGRGYGSPDDTGYRPAGIVHEGEYVVPKRLVQNPAFAPMLGGLESARLRGYADGGFVLPRLNTTPSAASGAAQPGGGFDARSFEVVVGQLAAVVAAMPRRVTAQVVYTDIEEAGTTLNSIRSEAGI